MKVFFRGNAGGCLSYYLHGYDSENDVCLDGTYDVYENGKIIGPLGDILDGDIIAAVMKASHE